VVIAWAWCPLAVFVYIGIFIVAIALMKEHRSEQSALDSRPQQPALNPEYRKHMYEQYRDLWVESNDWNALYMMLTYVDPKEDL
jgi:hypothetical protein